MDPGNQKGHAPVVLDRTGRPWGPKGHDWATLGFSRSARVHVFIAMLSTVTITDTPGVEVFMVKDNSWSTEELVGASFAARGVRRSGARFCAEIRSWLKMMAWTKTIKN